MSFWMKTCAHPGCTHEFPEHYFSDYCGDHHHTPEAIAQMERIDAAIASSRHPPPKNTGPTPSEFVELLDNMAQNGLASQKKSVLW